jgi:A118 family predicted phage portal protein
MNGWTEQKNEDGVITNPDPLNEFIHDVLVRNAFGEKMQEFVEQGLALGGAACKVWRDARRDREGNEIPNTGVLRLGYAMADQFVPLAWDNAKVYEGVFISRQARRGYYYTRLEWHRWNGTTYVITNELYRAEMQRGAEGENQDILGVRCPLSELFPELEEETEVRVDESLFTYWRTPIANNLDDNSPLGVSIYANALETLHAIDICYDSLVQEFRLGKKKIIVPARFLRAVTDPVTGQMRRYYDPNDESFIGMADDDGTSGLKDISVELRVEEHVAALNALLSVLCLQLGFSATTFSFDEHQGLKTATEVVSENSKTYKTIKTVQNQLRPAIEHLVRNIVDVAILYGMTDENGQPVERLAAPGYNVAITFDDGITQDRQTNINEGVMLVGAGLLSKYSFMTDPKYGQGLTPEQAQEEIDRIKAEGSTINVAEGLNLFGGGA